MDKALALALLDSEIKRKEQMIRMSVSPEIKEGHQAVKESLELARDALMAS